MGPGSSKTAFGLLCYNIGRVAWIISRLHFFREANFPSTIGVGSRPPTLIVSIRDLSQAAPQKPASSADFCYNSSMEININKSMLKKPIFIEAFVLLFLTGALNQIASMYNLYWTLYEFDSVVHFFGGATLSAFFIWLYFFSGFFEPQNKSLKNFLLVSLFGAMFVATSWEIYELLLGETLIQKSAYPYDTMMDFIMDFLGALTICFYSFLRTQTFNYE